MNPDKIIEENRITYNSISREWENNLKEFYDFKTHKKCRERFVRRLNGKKIMEAGCGLGYDSIQFQNEGYDVFAIDIAKNFITSLQSKNIKAVVMDMTKISITDKFNGIFLFASFLHVPPELIFTTLSNFYNLLLPKGILFLHHVESVSGYSEYVVENVFNKKKNLFCFTLPKNLMEQSLLATGFRKVEFFPNVGNNKNRSETGIKYGLRTYDLVAYK